MLGHPQIFIVVNFCILSFGIDDEYFLLSQGVIVILLTLKYFLDLFKILRVKELYRLSQFGIQIFIVVNFVYYLRD